jgi:hypothetical protein
MKIRRSLASSPLATLTHHPGQQKFPDVARRMTAGFPEVVDPRRTRLKEVPPTEPWQAPAYRPTGGIRRLHDVGPQRLSRRCGVAPVRS